ncbi:hypothetical protein QBC46DRAFT_219463, partial [Diplogelasinospora grovesii]
LLRARVLLYSWNAKIISNALTNLKDEAKTFLRILDEKRLSESRVIKPLLFICYSLGGLLLKK